MALLTTAEMPRPSRGGRPRDPSRDGVIRAAILRLLADVGYGALTMDAVASEAGVGKATIYRRWRTKQDLVVDTITDLNRDQASPPDTGSLEGDVRAMLQALLGIVNGPAGAATLSLLSTVAHEPALADAFRRGPLVEWRKAFETVWSRAQERGEVSADSSGALISEATSGPIVQRWLLTGEPVDESYVEEIMRRIALPLIRSATA
jgi:AcrR family transcriptional regulator